MIREGFTPATITSALQATTYGGKSLGTSVGIKPAPVVTQVTSPTLVSEGSYDAFLQRIAQGQAASKQLLVLDRQQKKTFVRYTSITKRHLKEEDNLEQTIKTYNVFPFKVPVVETPKAAAVVNPFQLATLTPYEQWKNTPTTLSYEEWAKQKGISITSDIGTGGGTAGARGGGVAPLSISGGGGGGGRGGIPVPTPQLVLSDEYNKKISQGSGSFTAAVDIGGGLMQDYLIRYGGGKITSYDVLGTSEPISKTQPSVKLQNQFEIPKTFAGGTFGGAGAGIGSLYESTLNALSPIKSNIIPTAKFAIGVGARFFGVAPGEKVTQKTVGEEFYGGDLSKIPASIFARTVTAEKESTIIKDNIEGYNTVATQLGQLKTQQDNINDQIKKINDNSKQITDDITLRTKLVQQIGQDYKDGKISYGQYKSYYDQFQNIYKSYLDQSKTITKQGTDLKKQGDSITTQAESLMKDPNYKAISDLVKERGPITSIQEEIGKSGMPAWQQVAAGVSAGLIELGGYFSTPVRILKGGQLISTGTYDISKGRYLAGGLETGAGALAIAGPSLLKAGAKTPAGQAVTEWLGKPFLSSTAAGGATEAAYEGLGTAGTTGIGFEDLTRGAALKYALGVPGIAGIGTLTGLEAYKGGASLPFAIGMGAGTAGGLVLFPEIQKQFTYEVRPQTTAKPELTYEKELGGKTQIAIQQGSTFTGRDIFFEGDNQGTVTREYMQPLKYTSAAEETYPGVVKPAYVKAQLTAQNLLSKIGIDWTPTPIYIGTPEGGTVIAGFGKGSDVFISPERAEREYNLVLNGLQNQGLTLAEAKKVLDYVPPKDLLYIGEAEGVRKVIVQQAGLMPTTEEKGIKQISILGEPTIKEQIDITGGKLTSYPLATQTTYEDPFTGKSVRVTSGQVVLSALGPGEATTPGQTALAFKARVQPEEIAKLGTEIKTFTGDIPYLRSPLIFQGGTTEFLLKTKGEPLELGAAAERKEFIQKGFAPEKYEGAIRETGPKGGEVFTGEEKFLTPTKRITQIYDPDTPELVATRVREVTPEGKLSNAMIQVNPDYSEYNFYKDRIKDTDFEAGKWAIRPEETQYPQISVRQQPITVPKELRGEPVTVQYLPKEGEQLTPDTLLGSQEGRKMIVSKELVSQYDIQPPLTIKREAVFAPQNVKLVIANPDTGQSIDIPVTRKVLIGQGIDYSLKSFEDADPLVLDPQFGVQLNTGSRLPSKVYSIFEAPTPESTMAKMDWSDVLKEAEE